MRPWVRLLRWILPLLIAAVGGWHLRAWWVARDKESARWFVQEPPPRGDQDLGPRVVRGPYLQSLTPNSVVVRWRTDVPAPSRVRVTPKAGGPANTVVVEGDRHEHEVKIEGLVPDTAYLYGLVHDERVLEGAPEPWSFTTWPQGPVSRPVRVWVLGDSGTASPTARAVRDAYLTWANQRLPDVWLMLGDNAYNHGTDLEYQAAVFQMYPDILARMALWPTRGNHDKSPLIGPTPYFEIFTLPTEGQAGGVPSGTESYYAFDFGNVHFINLDSYASDRGPGSAMLKWLKADLARTRARWIISYFHHPPYTKGSHDSDREGRLVEMREHVVPVLERAGVDLVLAGHSHTYERSYLLAGHHDASGSFQPGYVKGRGGANDVFTKRRGPGGGTLYVVAGASGDRGGKFAGLNHPAMAVSSATLGSLVLDITEERIEAHYVTDEAEVFDDFVLQKPR